MKHFCFSFSGRRSNKVLYGIGMWPAELYTAVICGNLPWWSSRSLTYILLLWHSRLPTLPTLYLIIPPGYTIAPFSLSSCTYCDDEDDDDDRADMYWRIKSKTLRKNFQWVTIITKTRFFSKFNPCSFCCVHCYSVQHTHTHQTFSPD